MKYEKTILDKNLAKFTVNDDCRVVGDVDNISKLYNYFDILNKEQTGISKQDMAQLKLAHKCLNNILDDHVSSSDNTTQTVLSSYQSVESLLNDHVIYDLTDPLARLLPEEAAALIFKYGTQQQKDSVPEMNSIKDMPYWFANLFSDVYNAGEVGNYQKRLLFARVKSDDVDVNFIPTIRDNKKIFGRSKRIIDNKGGIKALFEYAKNGGLMKKIAKNFGVPELDVPKYLQLYNFSGWKEWERFAIQHSDWNDAYKILAEKTEVMPNVRDNITSP